MASGAFFDVDAFLKSSSITGAIVSHRGETTKIGEVIKDSGFSVTINPKFGDLKTQIPAALRFLKKQRRNLERLASHPKVSDRRLVFTYCPGDVMRYENFSDELLLLAGSFRIGIAISFYPGESSMRREV